MAEDEYQREYEQVPGMQQALKALEASHFTNKMVNRREIRQALDSSLNEIIRPIKFVVTAAMNPLALITGSDYIRQMRLKAAMDELSSIPEGKKLVDAMKPNIKITLKEGEYPSGTCYSRLQFCEDGLSTEAGGITIGGYATRGAIIGVMAHELQHNLQIEKNVLRPINGKIPSPIEQLWYNRLIEGDAQATAADIAWKLKEAGKPAAWHAMKDPGVQGRSIADAYERAVEADSAAAHDGRAKRAAFDQWFEARSLMGIKVSELYNGQGAMNVLNPKLMEEAVEKNIPLKPMTRDDMERLGDLSDVNYLKIPSARPLDDPFYRDANWTQQEAKLLLHQHKTYDDIARKSFQSKFIKSPVDATPAPQKPAADKIPVASKAAPKQRHAAMRL